MMFPKQNIKILLMVACLCGSTSGLSAQANKRYNNFYLLAGLQASLTQFNPTAGFEKNYTNPDLFGVFGEDLAFSFVAGIRSFLQYEYTTNTRKSNLAFSSSAYDLSDMGVKTREHLVKLNLRSLSKDYQAEKRIFYISPLFGYSHTVCSSYEYPEVRIDDDACVYGLEAGTISLGRIAIIKMMSLGVKCYAHNDITHFSIYTTWSYGFSL